MDVRTVEIMGVRVDDVTSDEAMGILRACIRSGKPHQIVTNNTEFVVAAQKDSSFRQIINHAHLSIPDGIGLLWASRILGQPLRQHVRGTDLVDRLMGVAAEEDYRVFLLGAAEGVASLAAQNLRKKYPKLQIVGTHAGFHDPGYDDTVVDIIRKSGHVDILLVAYGAPAQDKWIARNLDRLGIPVAIGVGGVLDFFSERVRRAPEWIRRAEMEWLYRLIKQPWRWRRQLALPYFVALVLLSRLRAALGAVYR